MMRVGEISNQARRTSLALIDLLKMRLNRGGDVCVVAVILDSFQKGELPPQVVGVQLDNVTDTITVDQPGAPQPALAGMRRPPQASSNLREQSC